MTTPTPPPFPSVERMRAALKMIDDVLSRTKFGYSVLRDEAPDTGFTMSRGDLLFLHNTVDYLRMEITSIFRAALAHRQEQAARHHGPTCPDDTGAIDLDFIKFEDD